MMINFYDTCSLLSKANTLFTDNEERFVISSITLEELENIKTSTKKDNEVKQAARKVLHLLHDNLDKYDIHIFTEDMLYPIEEKQLVINNDIKILAAALDYNYYNKIKFITGDLSLYMISTLFFNKIQLELIAEEEPEDTYTGFLDVKLDNQKMEEFYSYPDDNYLNAYVNQYIIIRNLQNDIVDRKVWTGNGYRNISFETFESKHFGRIKPLDIQQQMAADSFVHNRLTMIKGPAGSGKSYLALGFLFNQLEKHNIDKILVFCNTVAAKGAARLGFLPGSREEKLLDSQIGNLLSSKLGSRIELERLVENEELILLPMSDIRGYDTSGMRAGIYISEAQNLDISLMKLALQRIGEDSICIIDGDEKTQVDDVSFAGTNNGMRRVSKIFRGENIFGEVELKEIHRSQIAKIAQKM